MQLRTISIHRKQYGDDAGKYEGTINIDSNENSDEMTAIIPHEVAAKIVVLCADELVNVAKVAAYDMTADLLEQVKHAQIEEQKDDVEEAQEVEVPF